ncbi:4Fe-4S binding protein [Methanobacterium formicicum]|uniref:ATPase n=1 Tax=Methanobacterium formicicum (strain DSM 3637 / PP1) TaxID=1204725 RepID=K2RAN5_METFP|nr:4Fe-4S binding protein [Methanobacterium formicicum]EKF85354.1 ATPase [Methanobacterium formicicum DSM 3637]
MNNNVIKIAITGGKGGTGKSTVSTSLAMELSRKNRVILVDADVECPDDRIILSTTQEKVEDVESLLPFFNQDKCSKCGACSEVCRENALIFVKDKFPFISGQCNGCGACLLVCPFDAIQEGKQIIGAIYQGKYQRNNDLNLLLVWGEIEVGCENTSLLVKATRDYALDLVSGEFNSSEESISDSGEVISDSGEVISDSGEVISNSSRESISNSNINQNSNVPYGEDKLPNNGYEYVIIDTAAGTHCNVINALMGVDLALAVTEPTPLGKHDLELILSLLEIMETPVQIVVNKSDMGDLNLIKIVSQDFNIPLIQEIPYEKDILKKHARNQPVTHENIKKLADSILNLSIKTSSADGVLPQ